MRKIKFLLISFMALFIAFGMASCSSEDERINRTIQQSFRIIISTSGSHLTVTAVWGAMYRLLYAA